MDQTQELDVASLPPPYVNKMKQHNGGIVQESYNGERDDEKRNVKKIASIKSIKTKPRRSCKPYFKFFLRFGVIVAISGIAYWTIDVSRTMVQTFWGRPDSFTVDTLK